MSEDIFSCLDRFTKCTLFMTNDVTIQANGIVIRCEGDFIDLEEIDDLELMINKEEDDQPRSFLFV